MAHKLEIRNNKASFFTAREPAWHQLGHVVKEAQTAEQAIKLANLDFEVALAELQAVVGDQHLPVPSRFATYRTDTNDVFGVVGSRYTTVQNREAFDFFDTFIDKSEAIFETAGVLGKGETVFITAKLPDYISVHKDDIAKYLLLTMSHDGTGSIQAMFTPVRVVCNNTLQYALQKGGKRKVTIRHTKTASAKLKAASTLLGIANNQSKLLEEAYNELYKTPCSDKQFGYLLGAMYYSDEELYTLTKKGGKPKDVLHGIKYNRLLDMFKYYQNGVGQENIRGTMWGAYNAVTGYYQNVNTYKDADSMFNNVVGNSQTTKIMADAFDFCLNPSTIETTVAAKANSFALTLNK